MFSLDASPINFPSPIEDPVFKRGWACPPHAGGNKGEKVKQRKYLDLPERLDKGVLLMIIMTGLTAFGKAAEMAGHTAFFKADCLAALRANLP